MTGWIEDGEAGSSVRAKLNTLHGADGAYSGATGGGATLVSGMGNDTGYGGDVNITSGNGGATSGGGGYVTITAGAATSDGNGGTIGLLAGAGINASGGDIMLTPGTASGGGRNGLIFLALPSSDPGVFGAMWVDPVTHIVKISS